MCLTAWYPLTGPQPEYWVVDEVHSNYRTTVCSFETEPEATQFYQDITANNRDKKYAVRHYPALV